MPGIYNSVENKVDLLDLPEGQAPLDAPASRGASAARARHAYTIDERKDVQG